MPPELDTEKTLHAREGVKSLFLLPLVGESGLLGFIGFDAVQEAAEWTEDTLRPIHHIADTIATAMERRDKLQHDGVWFTEESNLWRTLINHLPDKIYVKNLHSRFVMANPAVAERFDLPSTDEIIGKSDFELLPREQAARYFGSEQGHLYVRLPYCQFGRFLCWPAGQPALDADNKSPAAR